MTNTVILYTIDGAEFLATMPALIANGHKVSREGRVVTLSNDALDVLAALDPEVDGHYSYGAIWIGGTLHRVELDDEDPIAWL